MDNKVKKRVLVIGVIITVFMFALISRIISIQVINNKYLTDCSINQRILQIPVDRNMISGGDILDRNMIPFTRVKTIKKIFVFPKAVNDMKRATSAICSLTDKSQDEIHTLLSGNEYYEFTVKNENPTIEKFIREGRINGIIIESIIKRYSEQSIARHVIGFFDPRHKELSGGIEKQYGDFLYNTSTSRMVTALKDANRRILSGVGYHVSDAVSSKENHDIKLTLDFHIQKGIEEIMDRKSYDGAIVVMDIKSGKILAMVSRPNYEQNSVPTMTYDQLRNKCIDAYELGSVFKLIIAATAIQDGIIDFQDEFLCLGYKEIGHIRVKCNDEHGFINFAQGFSYSCNVAFIEAAQRIGGQKIIEMAQSLGLGCKTGIELPTESKGSLPEEKEYAGLGIGNLALGQGSIKATPIQIAKMVSIIAGGGINVNPVLVDSIIDRDGNTENQSNNKEHDKQHRIISEKTSRNMMELMEKVTLEGTGKQAYSFIAGGTAGKTGTPQAGAHGYHSWFAGYYPVKNPDYAVVVFIKDKSSGGSIAAPLFKEIVEYIDKTNTY